MDFVEKNKLDFLWKEKKRSWFVRWTGWKGIVFLSMREGNELVWLDEHG